MNILLCSIIRNEARHLDRWYTQLKRTVQGLPEHTFTLSVHENDSDDGGASKLASFDWSFIQSHVITTARLNCPFFIGGKAPERTAILAHVRNACMQQSPFLNQMDAVVWIEPDVEYTHEVISAIINHEKVYGVRADVFTGKSVHPGGANIYDSWGTRKTNAQTDWRDEDGQTAGLEPLWTTWNCLAFYRAEPIKRGLRFSGTNPRTGQPDCDTVNIVESFRLNGYDKVYWHTDLHIIHYCS